MKADQGTSRIILMMAFAGGVLFSLVFQVLCQSLTFQKRLKALKAPQTPA